jgi:hypothetical protein
MNGMEKGKSGKQPSAKHQQEHIDILLNCMQKLEKSKTGPLLNLFYSFMVGLLSSCLAKRITKAHGALGVIIGLASFMYSRKLNRPCIKE